jgi:dTDP-4-amino-4,6-dideoxygalactose transaminase
MDKSFRKIKTSRENLMNIPFTDLKSQYTEAKIDIDCAIQDYIDRSSFITGPDVEKFEKIIANYCGAEDCAATGSGTTALQVALKSCNIGPGDEVITTSHTFVSTVEAIINVGAIPIMIDIDDYYHMDIDQIENKINAKTRAILYVSLYGQTPDVDRFRQLADQHGLYLIEDGAHSFGGEYKGRRVGSLADLTCISFNPVKNLGAMGDSGCVTGRTDLIKECKTYRNHGRNTKFVFEKIGYNARIDNIQAAVILAKLPYFDRWLKEKNRICERYNQELSEIVTIPKTAPYTTRHGYYVYVIETDNRDSLREFLKKRGIGTNLHYPIPNHMQPCFQYLNNAPLPRLEATIGRILSIPCYHSLTDDQQTYIINSIKEWKSLQ